MQNFPFQAIVFHISVHWTIRLSPAKRIFSTFQVTVTLKES